MFGVPMDYTVCYRPGARFGPNAIRQASYGLEHYSMQFQDSLENRSFYDAGDLILQFGNSVNALDRISEFVDRLLKDGKVPLALGGEHLISLPIIKSVYRHYPDVHILHFDAHADLADKYFNESYTHATVMRRVLDFIPYQQFDQFGIRSADRAEVEFARQIGHHPFELAEPLQAVLDRLDPDTPLYLSLDVDVLDPAFAPGTGTPEAGGITPKELFQAFKMLKGRNVIGADFVEVAPDLDASNCTSVLGAKIIREILVALFERVGSTISLA